MTIVNDDAVTYFIADLHLTENRPDITACFLSFLQNDAPKADKLYILGDLFEAWIGDDDDSPFVAEVAQAIKCLSYITPVYFIHGNRDFLLGQKYAEISGMKLLPEIELIDLYGQSVLIMHGDTLCTKDIGYQKFRKKSRSWWWQAIIKSLPLFIRKKIAADYRAKSAAATAMKADDIMDVTQEEVISSMQENNSLLLIHGHTHRPAIHNFEIKGKSAQRIVLGDWYEQGSWLQVSPNNIELLNRKL